MATTISPETSQNGKSAATASDQQRRRVRAVAQRAIRGLAATPLDQLDILEQSQLQRQRQLGDRRQRLADRLLLVLGSQLAVADIVFLAYVQFGVHWHVPQPVITAWLAFTLVQVLGIALAVVRVTLQPAPRSSGRTL